jgi:hypothetical protein
MILRNIILDKTLPAGAVPARLMRSGEYSIRETFDLIGESSLYWFADASGHGSRLRGNGSQMPAFQLRLWKFMVRRAVRLRVRWAGETKVAGVLK